MIRKIMPNVVSGQDLLSLEAEVTVQTAVDEMTERNVHAVLVVEADSLVGLFTGTDLIQKVVAKEQRPDETTLREVMTANPKTVTPETDALEALHIMQDGNFRHLPVIEDGNVVGIVSRRDFLHYEIDELERQEKLWNEM